MEYMAFQWKNNEDYIFIPEIYDLFENEYKSSVLLYPAFIDDKDLGVKTSITKENEMMYGREIHCDYYKIVDEQKFFLAKIKYGI
jgi:hypothetical protein